MKVEAVVGPNRGVVGYLAYDHAGGSAVIIDAPYGTSTMYLSAVARLELKVLYIVTTHGHWDQIADNCKLAAATEAPVCAHTWDMGRLADPRLSIERMEDKRPDIQGKRADQYLMEGQVLNVGDLEFTVLHTPGHTPGSICLYESSAHVLFTGDLLMKQEIGRSDYPGGNKSKLQESLLRLAEFPDRTKIFPAHGLTTTLGNERWLLDLAKLAIT